VSHRKITVSGIQNKKNVKLGGGVDSGVQDGAATCRTAKIRFRSYFFSACKSFMKIDLPVFFGQLLAWSHLTLPFNRSSVVSQVADCDGVVT